MQRQAEDRLTSEVAAAFAKTKDARLRQVMQSLVRHLHQFVREVELTEAEWMAGIQFLTAVGKRCDDVRQEFILLSDTLGVSMQVDAINHGKPKGATESSVLGPFYREGAPEIAFGGSIVKAPSGEACAVRGRVTGAGGKPIAGAVLDVWQTSASQMYEGQDPDQPAFNLRGRVRTDADGRYAFETVLPVSYPIPHDGPVGKMLKATGRHPFRPAHLHFIVSAPGHEPVTTMVFVKGDKYLRSDAVFGVKDSLVTPFRRRKGANGAEQYEMEYDFGLKPAASAARREAPAKRRPLSRSAQR
jgi:hydroxyquinol 1,2-dioxygenase